MFLPHFIREKQYFPLDCTNYNVKLTWPEVINIINLTEEFDTYHVGEFTKTIQFSKLGRIIVTGLEGYQDKLPDYVILLYNELVKTFYKNNISIHLYVSLRKESRSYPPHKDGMDVFYLQSLNTINMKIYPHKDGSLFNVSRDLKATPHAERAIFSRKMVPGHSIWIPRGTYHHIVPLEPRVGFSFGVEGDTDPCTYV